MGRWIATIVLLGALLGACIGAELVPCGDGTACPEGFTCAAGGGCRSPDQLAACAGLDEVAPCTLAGEAGFCAGGACVVARCGNGLVEHPEACDDGNAVPGDGCNFDCSSTEACGNGTLDFFAGEQCDDANRRNLDGCSAHCGTEELRWELVEPVQAPARYGIAMAYDAARRRMVMFGGYAGIYTDGTYELEEQGWRLRTVLRTPRARYAAALAYDSHRARIVLHGGDAPGTALDDTWTYDGVAWTRLEGAGGPRRSGHAMAYDAGRKRVVMFTASNASETWELDGGRWTERVLPVSPSKRGGTAMVYDAKRGRIVLFGGQTASALVADTWILDGAGWTQLQPPASPPAREGHTLAYDARRGVVVLHGGRVAGIANDTWEFDGTTWAQIMTPTSPSSWSRTVTAYDLGRDRVIRVGGSSGMGVPQRDVWEYDGATWRQQDLPPARPASRFNHALAADPVRGRVVMFGADAVGVPSETWELAGSSWTRLAVGGPPTRVNPALVYDPVHRRIVLFGGQSTAGILADTWQFDGAAWTQLATTGAPSPRYLHALAFDARRKVVVLFGGQTAPDRNLAETWELDGATWVQRAPAASPPARTGHGMVWDARRERIVLVGGTGDGITAADTWEYDGATWSAVATATTPPPRGRFGIAYDLARRALVMMGGDGFGVLDDTWELRSDWVDVSSSSPGTRSQHPMTYDAIGRRSVLFAGLGANGAVGDTRAFGAAPLEAGEACEGGIDYDADGAAGCADDECWAQCTPLCAPGTTCTDGPRCGDGSCDALENCRNCPADCSLGGPACPAICGDAYCDAPDETLASCPGDCTP